MTKFAIAVPLLAFAATPAEATGGLICRTSGQRPLEIALVVGHTAVSAIVSARLSDNGRNVPASLAPPGKRALYLGYANMPDGIGWVLGSLIAGSQYEQKGDKINLARRFLADQPVELPPFLDEE